MAVAIYLAKTIVKDLLKKLKKKEALKNAAQAIVASLMKIRKDRSLLFQHGSYPKMLILSEKILFYLTKKAKLKLRILL
jgi:ABC-type transporter Mla maintaining outer membrane lipid asymmetry ATPase subunit MlaF